MIFITRFMNSFLHQASFATGYWYYDRHRSVRLVILVGLAIDQIAQSGLSSLSVIYYSAQLFSRSSGIKIQVIYGKQVISVRERRPNVYYLRNDYESPYIANYTVNDYHYHLLCATDGLK